MRHPVLNSDAAREWYETTPKWVIVNVLRQIAASQSTAGCDAGLDDTRHDGWFPIVFAECKRQRSLWGAEH